MSKSELDLSTQSKTQLVNRVKRLQRRVEELEKLGGEGDSRAKLAERFGLALWATNSAIWDWDVERKLFWSSPGNQRLFGRNDDDSTEPFDIEDDDDPWLARLHPEDRARVVRCFRDHLAHDTPLDVEYRFRPPGGEYIWIRSIGRALRAPDGVPLRVLGSNSDVTARKLAEIEARRFREAVDNASEGIGLYDAEERFVYANKRYREMFSEVAHLLKAGARREDLRQAFYSSGAVLAAVGREDEFIDESRHRRAAGGASERRLASGIWIKRSDHVLPDGGIVSVRSDITELKRREEELRRSEAYFRAIFEDAAFGIAITRIDGHLNLCNPAYRDMLGYGVGELDGKHWSEFTDPRDMAEDKRLSEKLLRGEIASFRMEKRFIRKDGAVLWTNLIVSLIGDDVEPARFYLAMIEDIGARRKAEETLRGSAQYLSGVMGNIADCVVTIDEGGTILSFNRAAEREFGYRAEEVIGGGVERLMPEPHQTAHADYLRAYGESGESAILGKGPRELEGVRRDGTRFPMELAISEMHIDGQRVFIGAMRDITRRKRNLAALRESEENLIESQIIGRVGSWHWDLVSDELWWSEGLKRLYRMSPDEPTPSYQTFLTSLPPEDARRVDEKVKESIREAKSFRATYRYICADGVERILQGRGEVFVDDGGNVIRMAGTAADITRQKQTEQALRESEARLTEAQQLANVGSWVVYVEAGRQTETLWSAQLRRIFGIGRDAVPQGADAYLRFVHEEDRDMLDETWTRALASDVPYEVEHRIVRPNGEVRYIHTKARSFGDHSPAIRHWVGATTDVTERKLAEEKLHQAQKMEAVGQLTGGIAHDFNNLLAVMLGNLELVREHVNADGAVREMIERGVKAAERGAALTDRLLAFSRKHTLLPTAIDLNRLVSDMSELLRRALGKTIEIGTGGAQDLWLCRADRAQLENALLNLSLNARDAMVGGGRLTIETANMALDDQVAAARADVEPGRYVMLGVSDTGSGITEETLEHVFEPFFTTKEVGKGSGLGLSMVYGFAKQSGGNVTIYSEPGEGTTVKLYLPALAGRADGTVEDRPAVEIPRSRGEHILVVEDDSDVRALAVALLSNLGYQTVQAENARAALDIMAHAAPLDLLLSDVILPGAMNGTELAAEIRRRDPTIKVVYMTGYAEDAFRNHAGLDERTHVIDKPFKKIDFALAIRKALDES